VIPDFYTSYPEWPGRVEHIVELLGRVTATEELSGRTLELRRTNRLGAVHSSTAIEGNELTLAQVAEVANGEPVLAPLREVREVENALAAYDALDSLDPWSVDDVLVAHRLLTAGLITESGVFRSVEVDIVNAHDEVIHTGSRADKVPRLVRELFEWGQSSTDYPLVVASATHFLIEHIHPFRDGNGRIGRLWQTLILSRWRPVFAWMPTESLIRKNQAGYYQALQDSRDPVIDAALFIDYMLDVVTQSLELYQAQALANTDVGVNVGVNEAILAALVADPTLTAAALAAKLGATKRTIERHLAELKAAGRLRREGAPKNGRWMVVPP